MEECSGHLGQPAFAPPVVFDVAVAVAAGGAETEIKFLDVLVLAQRGGGAIEHHAAVFENIAMVGNA